MKINWRLHAEYIYRSNYNNINNDDFLVMIDDIPVSKTNSTKYIGNMIDEAYPVLQG